MEYRQVIRRLTKYDPSIVEQPHRGKGSHRMVAHERLKRSHPLKYHGDKTFVPKGVRRDLERKFELPDGLLT